MVLLNQSGRVAEATAAAILMVRDGKVHTTPAWEGALESLTVDVCEALAHSLGIKFLRHPIERTELLLADELAVCGTLHEITPVKSIEGRLLPAESPILGAIRTRYFNAVRGGDTHPSVELSILPQAQAPNMVAPSSV